MKKKYMKPVMVVEVADLQVFLKVISADSMAFGGGNGGTSTGTGDPGDDNPPIEVNARGWDFNDFETDLFFE